MKAVMISMRPEWCEWTAIGEKTDELRKNAPKLPTPFRCYIYQTITMWGYPILGKLGLVRLRENLAFGKGKVIGEFICDRIEQIDVDNEKRISNTSKVSLRDMWEYAHPKSMYDLKAWHISNLVIYDKPKQIEEFMPHCKYMDEGRGVCDHLKTACPFQEFQCSKWPKVALLGVKCRRHLKRPPQSWCYVEELEDGK